jgi:hypothetical protein
MERPAKRARRQLYSHEPIAIRGLSVASRPTPEAFSGAAVSLGLVTRFIDLVTILEVWSFRLIFINSVAGLAISRQAKQSGQRRGTA